MADNVIDMKTNESNRNNADRRIPLSIFDQFLEIAGNMKGTIRQIFIDKDKKVIYTYHNDHGFNEEDKEALHMKNMSGNNTKTAGLNGHGIKLVIDRLLSENGLAQVYSLNDGTQCQLGHFAFTPWENIKDLTDLNVIFKLMEIKETNTGSLFKIPITSFWMDKIIANNEKLRFACNKFFNKLIFSKEIEFFWNTKKQEVDALCPEEGSIKLKYEIGHFKKNDNTSIKTKSTYLKIVNFDLLTHQFNISGKRTPIKTIINRLTQISGTIDLTKQCIPEGAFCPIDTGIMVLNVIDQELRPNENNKDISIREYDGVNIYIEKHNINLTSSRKKLGIEVTTAYAHYAGRPRFENHISKTTRQYYLPPDKTNIKPTNFGEQVQGFMCKVTRSTITKDREDRNDADSDDNIIGAAAVSDADSDDNIIGADTVSDADSDDNIIGAAAVSDADSDDNIIGADTVSDADSVDNVVGTDTVSDADSVDNVVGTDADPDADSVDNVVGTDADPDADSVDNVVGTDADPDADSVDNVVGTDADPDADSVDNVVGTDADPDADSVDNVVGTDADPDADSVDVRARVDFDHKARKAISDTYYEWCFKNQERANKCLLCLGYTFQGGPRALEYCHIIPDKLGGNPVIENGILLCKHCNRGAGGTDMREYLQETWHDPDRTATFKRILKEMGKSS